MSYGTLLERYFIHIRIVTDKMNLQTASDIVSQFGKVFSIFFWQNDTIDTTSFSLEEN